MNKTNYISVNIDVGLAFSLMSIVDQYENLILKPFKIIHNNSDSLDHAATAIKKAEESNSMKFKPLEKALSNQQSPIINLFMLLPVPSLLVVKWIVFTLIFS